MAESSRGQGSAMMMATSMLTRCNTPRVTAGTTKAKESSTARKMTKGSVYLFEQLELHAEVYVCVCVCMSVCVCVCVCVCVLVSSYHITHNIIANYIHDIKF